jgi:alpha-tubulin suppressor-like RCC1 family protein
MDFKIRLKKVSCGDTHTAMLSSEGLLYMLGNGQGGKLGIPNVKHNELRSPTLVEDLIPTQSLDQSGQPFKNQVIDVVCAVTYTLAVT